MAAATEDSSYGIDVHAFRAQADPRFLVADVFNRKGHFRPFDVAGVIHVHARVFASDLEDFRRIGQAGNAAVVKEFQVFQDLGQGLQLFQGPSVEVFRNEIGPGAVVDEHAAMRSVWPVVLLNLKKPQSVAMAV